MIEQAAVERLRAYVPPPTNYDSVPLTRRAAVLILLFADQQGELRVVLTIRSKTLSSCKSSQIQQSRNISWRMSCVSITSYPS